MVFVKKIIALSLMLFFSVLSFPQNNVQGVVIDANTKQPLAFASVFLNDIENLGTATDIDGRFSLVVNNDLHSLTISHIGYKTKTFNAEILKFGTSETFLLERLNEALPETVLIIKNPAIPIIKQVIKNKKSNNPDNLESYAYNSYSKIVIHTNQKDSIDNETLTDKSYLFISETLSKKKYLSPDLSNEEIIANRWSGLKNSPYYFIATESQSFTFYEEPIKLLNQTYLSPINNDALKSYEYKLENKVLQNADTLYIISFKPKPQTTFNSLKGLLYINSENYALQNVIAEPAISNKINIKIQQLYQKQETSWFPSQLNYQATFNPIINNKKDSINNIITIDSKTYIDSVVINPILKRSDFAFENIFLNQKTNTNSESLIETQRRELLSKKEEKAYQLIDSISKEINLEQKLQLIEKLPLGKVSINDIDLDLKHLFNFNKHEGTRLGLGFTTNKHFNELFKFGGYFGYGFKDKKSKYGANVSFTPNPSKDLSFTVSWDKTLMETGGYGLSTYYEKDFFDFNLRNLISSQFDEYQSINFSVSTRSFRYLSWKIAVNQASIKPLYGSLTGAFNPYVFQYQNQALNDYNVLQFQFYLRYAYKERIRRLFDYNLSMGTDYPVFTIFYERGQKDIFNSDIDYNKIELNADHQIYLNKSGEIYYNLSAGIIDRPTPYGLLFGGHGSYDKKIPFITQNHFQTMRPYEFVSDKYVNLFFNYKIARLLQKNNLFSPDISIAHNMGIGSLTNNKVHQNIVFKTLEKPYLESGILLSSLINIDVYNISNFGIGGAVFYRYGFHSLDKTSNNVVFKVDFTMNIN